MDTLSYKTTSANKATVDKGWIVVDADSQVLGRLASEVAKMIRGKHKPSFTPHVDCGDNVIVINTDKVRLTGQKWTKKVYLRHTGFPGGIKATPAAKMRDENPEKLIRDAVEGMLPKNRLSRQLITKLKVYPATDHPHEAQQPETLDVGSMNPKNTRSA